ncbi:MAG: Fe(3+) ABC transporter substrate-binding protein [Pseudomonadota bacterium]
MKITSLVTFAFLSALWCSTSSADAVNVYSARSEQLIKPLLDRFTEETGIEIKLLSGKADALLRRLEIEGEVSPADVLITVDAGRLHRAKMMGLLQPVESENLSALVPATLRDKDSYWFGLSTRARVVMYARGRVRESDLSSYEDLANERWDGRICVQSSSSIYNQSLVASMIAEHGQDETLAWAKRLVKNFARTPRGGDRDQIASLASGECDIAIANTYYLAAMLRGKQKSQRKAAKRVGVFWPNQDDRGVHINVSGIGITKSAQNKENAIRLVEFLLQEDSQEWYTSTNFEYPVRVDVPTGKVLRKWGDFKADPINLTELGENNPVAVRLMDEAGWR